ncbi:MAG: hypothetical protein RTU30_15845, partial [Candidatus Thorarchaeota archaeon]
MARTESIRVATFLLMFIMLTPAFTTTAFSAGTQQTHITSEFTPKRVLVDESHTSDASDLWTPGNASLFGWILIVNGYNVSTNFDTPLDSGILNDYDILVLFFPMIELTAGEISAVSSFVSAGGGLMLAGPDGTNQWGYHPDNLNPLSEQYGVTFVSDKVSGVVTDLTGHVINTGITSFSLTVEIIYGTSLDVSTPAIATASLDDSDIVAVAESGLGRVVCLGTIRPFQFYRHQSSDAGVSDFQFTLNIIDWLAKNDQRTASIPEIAEITVGPGPDLSPSEVDEYDAYVGIYHDHTDHSDGRDSPTEMLEKALSLGIDWYINTDHSYDRVISTGGISGAKAMKALVEPNSLPIHVVTGAELSKGAHTVGFPLTEDVITGDQQTMVDGTHAQGGIAVFCHPTIGTSYAAVWEAYDDYGYDAFEVDNGGWMEGMGEAGFFRNFLGASDGHSADFLGTTMSVTFVQDPSGPNGALSDQDIVDAVLNKRIVVVDKGLGMVYGQEVWVDKWMAMWTEAESAVETAETVLEGDDNASTLSGLYLDMAQASLDSWCLPRAIKLAEDAASSTL